MRQLIDEFDARWPQFGVGTASVAAAYAGLYPVFGTWDAPEGVFAASRDPLVIDHGTRDDVQGLLSAVSVKFTTARALAERAVDWATKFIGRGDKSRTRDRSEPLALASIPDPSTYDAAAATSAARDEMALTLADVVFRRTTLGLRGDPGRTLLRELARGMAGPLGWEDARVDAEVASVAAAYDAVRPMAGAAPSHDV